MPDTAFEYEINSNGIKENIVVNQRQESYNYEFTIAATELTLFLTSENSIIAYNNSDETIFTIPAPFMYDSADGYSESVKYELAKISEEEYLLIIKADDSWINSDERIFPVMIDPMVDVPYSTANFEIMQITETNQRYTGSANWNIYHNSGGGTKKRLMVKYIAPVRIENVFLRELHYEINGDDKQFSMYKMPYNTSFSSFTWSSFGNICTSANKIGGYSKNHSLTYDFPFTDYYAFMLRFDAEETLFSTTQVNFTNFKAREHYSVETVPVSFENEHFNLRYNIVNSKQALAVPYFTQAAPLMPISIVGIFNEGFSANVRQRIMPSATDFYGKDWKLDIEQYMIKTKTTLTTYYTYIDAKGDCHIFLDSGKGYYESPTCNSLKYYESTKELGNDLNRGMMTFNEQGRLIKIRNADGQYITITHDTTGKITYIYNYIHKNTSGVYQQFSRISFTYSNNLLSNFYCYGYGQSSAIYRGNFSYSSSMLTKAVIDGRNIDISYASDRINTITNYMGIGFKVVYGTGYTEVQNYASGNTVHSYTRLGKYGKSYYENDKLMYKTSYIYSGNKRNCEITEYVSYDNITPPTKYTTYTGSSAQSAFLEKENKAEKNVSGDWVTATQTFTSAQMSKLMFPAIIVNASSDYVDINCSSGGQTKYFSYDAQDGTQLFIIPLTKTSQSTTVSISCEDVYNYGSGSIYFIGMGEMQSQNTTVKAADGTKTITSKSATETNTATINASGLTTKESIKNNKNEEYIATYTYKSSYLSQSELKYKNSNSEIVKTTKTYKYQNETTSSGINRALITSVVTTSGTDKAMEFYEYDEFGNVKKYTDENGYVYKATYETWKTSGQMVITNSCVNDLEPVTYSYDDFGILKSISDAKGTSQISRYSAYDQYVFGSATYDFNYLSSGNLSSINSSSVKMLGYTYDSNNNVAGKIFANNQSTDYTYDTYGNMLTKSSYKGTTKDSVYFDYTYKKTGELDSIKYDGYTKSYTTNADKTQQTTTLSKSGQSNFIINNYYDYSTSVHNKTEYTINGSTRTYTPYYKDDLRQTLTQETDGGLNVGYVYNADESISAYGVTAGSVTAFKSFNYDSANINGEYYRTNKVTSVFDWVFKTPLAFLSQYYTSIGYDNAGNITQLKRTLNDANGATLNKDNYLYDNSGRLIEEKSMDAKRYEYSYDTNNNISKVVQYNKDGTVYNTETYNYSSNKLASITNSNSSIATKSFSTDALGNHTKYNGGTLVWTRGRLLESYSPSSSILLGGSIYKYNENGTRYEKTIVLLGGLLSQTTKYYLDGSTIIAEDRGGTLIEYFYSSQGIIGFKYNGQEYIYIKDCLGNIIEIVDSSGNIIVKYSYDAWGNCKVLNPDGTENTSITFIGNINPFRYKGYYMDIESGFYYLQTRYYDPAVRRFINADNYELIPQLAQNIGELNLYSYCNNNPVMYIDESGELVLEGVLFFLGAAAKILALAFVVVAVALLVYVAAIYTVETVIPTISDWIGNIRSSKGDNPTRPWPGDNPAWPGDDPTVPPLPGAEWKGKPGSLPGSNEGQWYLPDGTRIHPNFGHKPPKPPHWGWYDELGRLIRDFFRPGGWGPGGPPTLA